MRSKLSTFVTETFADDAQIGEGTEAHATVHEVNDANLAAVLSICKDGANRRRDEGVRFWTGKCALSRVLGSTVVCAGSYAAANVEASSFAGENS